MPFPYTRIKIPHCGKIHEHTGVQIYTRAHSHTYTYSLHLGSFAVGGARDKFSGTEILFCYVGLGGYWVYGGRMMRRASAQNNNF